MPSPLEEQIHQSAIGLISEKQDGLRYSQLVEEVKKKLPDIAENTIATYLQTIDKSHPESVYRPSRGVFRSVKFKEEKKAEGKAENKTTVKESDFYEAFANYLVGGLGECTKAIRLGGKVFEDKWSTPDVIGIDRSLEHNPVKHPDVVVSAEIKFGYSANELITAFGQACAYKAFSHKVYLVIPNSSDEDDISRIEALCIIFGMGLILFDTKNSNEPKWEIKTRSLKTDPDYFYLNQNAEKIKGKTDLFD